MTGEQAPDSAAPRRPAGRPLPLQDFDYVLPPAAIAPAPAEPRDASRLMALHRRGDGAPGHHPFLALPTLLTAGDLLVVNRTQVMPARLAVRRAGGGAAELLLCRPVDGAREQARTWEAMGRPGKALVPGRALTAPDGSRLTVVDRVGGAVHVRGEAPLWPLMLAHGALPLPPYLAQAAVRPADAYQTIFAAEPGAVAAPTASLHFTPRLLQALAARGVGRAEVVLHVGPGTFVPVRSEHAADVRAHPMHAEAFEVPDHTQAAIARTRAAGGRVVAVGTTTVRALETWATRGQAHGEADLFIYPGYRFACVDALVTNFHLPRSTLLMLVAAMIGRDRLMAAYAEALTAGYRFCSFGDAMIVL